MPIAPVDAQDSELRDLLLKLVYLDEWEFYKPHFPVQKMNWAASGCNRPSQLLDWIRRKGSTLEN